MKRNFNELFSNMKPEGRERANARADAFLKDMALADLRRARARTQQQLARTLSVNQAWISRVERQTDMYLSTLRAYVEALGGELEVSVRFDDYVVRLNQFAELEGETTPGGTANALSETNATSTDAPIEIWDSSESGSEARPAATGSDMAERRLAEPLTTKSTTTGSNTTSKAA